MHLVSIKATVIPYTKLSDTLPSDSIEICKVVETISDLVEAYKQAALAMGFHPDTVKEMFGEEE